MDLEVDLECPQCKKKFKQKIKEMYPGNSRKCPTCGTTIKFSGDDMRKAQKGVDTLMKEFSKISKIK